MTLVQSGQEALLPTERADKPAGHSPRPWRLECGDHTHRYVHVTDADDRTVHYKYACAGPREGARDEDNARLIAAAPDLLEAGTSLLGAFVDAETARGNQRAEQHPAYVAMRAAILRATGAKP